MWPGVRAGLSRLASQRGGKFPQLFLRDIAARAGFSIRTLNRRFRLETGQKLQWVNAVRVHQAQEMLEATSDSVETIGQRIGFASAANFRE